MVRVADYMQILEPLQRSDLRNSTAEHFSTSAYFFRLQIQAPYVVALTEEVDQVGRTVQ